ncbi:hypothetical protein QA601_05535 [Chitinispirillales bacterium ANBcel5]|uniref:tetratricopeptide repeat protein n=1 Tax=Cellulosispirillum alkaliphilum TaxID=3039283 RepID=UPI002A511DC9|nr:hypothetical protein [Chitinispirillales bacterium ANBcel5]
MKNRVVISVVLLLFIRLAAFELTEERVAYCDSILTLILNSNFEKALSHTDAAIKKDSNDILAAVLHLSALGLRDLDYDEMVDSTAFLKSFERACSLISRYQRVHGTCSLSETLKGMALSMHASFYLRNRAYLAAYSTGMDAIRTLQEARELDPSNKDVNFFLGLYDYARAELRRRFWWVLFWYPGDKSSGIEQLEQCAQEAHLTRYSALLALSDIYLQEDKPEKSLAIIERLSLKFPDSRFVLWAKAKYYDDQGMYAKAAQVYGILSKSYKSEAMGSHNSMMTANKQAHMLYNAGKPEEAARVCRDILERAEIQNNRSLRRDTERLLRRAN